MPQVLPQIVCYVVSFLLELSNTVYSFSRSCNLEKTMVTRSNGWAENISEEAMDAQNREYQERLSQKTAFLKSLAVDIVSVNMVKSFH